jgi:chitodextrinase
MRNSATVHASALTLLGLLGCTSAAELESAGLPLSLEAEAPTAATAAIEEAVILDKIKGAWLGQMAGVDWGASTEFQYLATIIPDGRVPEWSPDMINDGFGQDDLYVEIPFIDALMTSGMNAGWSALGNNFRDTSYGLWHANAAGRTNLASGVPAPDSGDHAFSVHGDDIDWQIEADFVGQMCPGMVQTAVDLAWRLGHVMNFGDGVYGGVFIAAMHAASFTATDLDSVIRAGLHAVPVGSEYRQILEDVIAWQAAGHAFAATWELLQEKWGSVDRCPDAAGPLNIDAKLNGAYVLMGLLYGQGDFEESMRLAMRAGQDSDCNPSSVGAILGNMMGYEAIPAKWKSALSPSAVFANSAYTFDDAVQANLELARQAVLAKGGSIEGSSWMIPVEGPVSPPILEQWPKQGNARPELAVAVDVVDESTLRFSALATDADGIYGYQWDFGDLGGSRDAVVSHTYAAAGKYEVSSWAADALGNTSLKTFSVEVGPGRPREFNLAGMGNWTASVATPVGGSSRSTRVMHDGVKPEPGDSSVALQYDTFDDDPVAEEYIGYTFMQPIALERLVFQEGLHFRDGGWFANGSLQVQVRQNDVWQVVESQPAPSYPVGDSLYAFGASFETYTFALGGVVADGVRLYGSAGGAAHFLSIGELEVWAAPPAR